MENIIGNQIGSGGTSTVYEWGVNEVIKIFKPHVTDDVINNEKEIAEHLNRFSLDIPKYIDCIEWKGQRAIIYERIPGNIFAEPLLNGYYDQQTAHLFAKMHYDIHKKTIDALPSQYEFFKNRIVTSNDIFGDKTEPLLSLLDSIPKEKQLCHGDYQPLNIIGDEKKYVVIDWNGACCGSPVLDAAWSYMTLNSPVVSCLLGEAIADVFAALAREYLTHYCFLAKREESEIIKCLPLVAARRLYDNKQNDNDHSRQESKWLHQLIEKML